MSIRTSELFFWRHHADVVRAVCASLAFAGVPIAAIAATDSTITVSPDRVVNHITPWMYGSCIEDVNHEIYGGLYDQRIFGESFEEPPAADRIVGWKAYGGDWRVTGNTAHVGADAGAKLILDDPDMGDGAVEAQVRFEGTGGENAGLLVRVRNAGVGADEFDGYEVSLQPDGHVILGKHRHNWQPLRQAPVAVKAGEWNRLRVEMTGPRLRIYVNSAIDPAIDFTVPDHPLLTGNAALRTWNSDVSFQAVRTEPDGTARNASFRTVPGPHVSGQWEAVSTGSAMASFERDADHAYNDSHSQRIRFESGSGTAGIANRGLNHWGIATRKGHTFEGYLYLRGDGLTGPVTVALQSGDGKSIYAVKKISGVTGDWRKYSFELKPGTNDPNARFAVWIDRPGTLWVDQAVLMPVKKDRFRGLPIRKDIADMLVAGKVRFLRYGGTMVNVPQYRWKNMIGDPDKRPHYRGNWYSYATNGFGIFDFLNFCEAAHIASAFAINIEETDQDAADLADYLTAPVTTQWGRRRAEDGHPAPYDVRYIEIGNEEVLGGDFATGYAHYAVRFRALARAIHARNPKLALVCSAWWRPESPELMRPVFDTVNGEAAAWDLHVGSDDARSGVEVDRQLTQMEAMFKQWDPKTSLKCVIFEENGGLHNQQRALGHATTLNASLRHGDFVLADCPANCLQPLGQNDNGWDQGQIFFTPGQAWGMPPYYAQQMISSTALPLRVESAATSPGNDLDVTAMRSEDGKTLVLSVANCGDQAHSAAIDLGSFAPASRADVTTLVGQPGDINTPEQPTRIAPKRAVLLIHDKPFTVMFPAHSYTVMEVR